MGEVGEAFDSHPDEEGDDAESERVDSTTIEATPPEEEDEEEEEGNANFSGSMEASSRRGDEEIKMAEDAESVNASTDQDGSEDELEAGKRSHPVTTAGGGGDTALARALVAACADMDSSMLVDMLCLTGRTSFRARSVFPSALRGAPNPHALVVRAVNGFLARADSKTDRAWVNCVALLDCVPRLTAAPSADTLEQAESLVEDWKEMVVKPGSCRDMGRMAGWGLFTFLASYNIFLEFDADEIISLFGNLPRNKAYNCVELCKRLGLIDKMTDSINHSIEDGRPLDAVRLARALNLTYKYPPLSIMYDFVEKAKKTAEEILSMENYSLSLESLDQAMAKKVNALILSWMAVDECSIDSDHRNSIKAEITHLLHRYANKQQSLVGVSASVSTSHLQHNLEEQCPQQLRMVQEKQQQQQELQLLPEEKYQRQQHKRQEVVHQHQQLSQHGLQKQEWGWQRNQSRQKRRNPQENQKQQFNKCPRFSQYSYSGIRGVPFAARTRPYQDLGPHDRSQTHPANIPPLKPE